MQNLLTHETVRDHRLLVKARLWKALWMLAICWGISAAIVVYLIVLKASEPGRAPRVMQTWEYVLVAVAVASFVGGMAWFDFRMSRSAFRLRCPSCLNAIDDAMTLFKVTASCRCPHCEQVIFGSEGTPLVNHGHQNPHRSYEPFEPKTTLWIVAIWGAAGAFWCLVTKRMLEHWQLQLEAAVGEIAYPFLRVLVAAPGVVIFPLGILHAYRTFEFKSKKCPHCQGSLGGELVALTGCCGQCGGTVRPDRVVAPDEPAARNMLGMVELQNQCSETALRIESLSLRLMATVLPTLIVLLIASRWVGATLTNSLLLVVAGLTFRGMWKLDQIGNQVQCPFCSHPWLRHRWWVIASRRCGGCGRRVLMD